MSKPIFCWYLKKNTEDKVLIVEKREGVFFDSYEFMEPPGTYIPKKIKKQVKQALAHCPTFKRYHIAYDNDEITTILGVDNVTLNEYASFTNIQMGASEFWKFLADNQPEIAWPDAAQGPWVFNTLQENLNSGKVVEALNEHLLFDRENSATYYILPV